MLVGDSAVLILFQSLARAIYAQKNIVILDDVFSGLDALTENSVFHNLLGTNGILRRSNTTVIIATSRCKSIPNLGLNRRKLTKHQQNVFPTQIISSA